VQASTAGRRQRVTYPRGAMCRSLTRGARAGLPPCPITADTFASDVVVRGGGVVVSRVTRSALDGCGWGEMVGERGRGATDYPGRARVALTRPPAEVAKVRARAVCGRSAGVPLSPCGRDEPEGRSSCRRQVNRGHLGTQVPQPERARLGIGYRAVGHLWPVVTEDVGCGHVSRVAMRGSGRSACTPTRAELEF